MSDSKELIVALKNTEVASGIDMRMTKGDIIDMVVEERKAELEVELKALLAQNEPLMDQLKKLGKTHEKAFAEEFEKSNKTLINAFKKAFPKAVRGVETHSEAGFYFEKGEKGARTLVFFEDVADEYNRKDRVVQVSCTLKFSVKEGDVYRYGDSAPQQLKLTGDSKEHAAKLKKETRELAGKIQVLDDQIAETRSLISDLSKKGGRFKAEFTKRMLGGTEQGKSILASLDGVRSIVKGIK